MEVCRLWGQPPSWWETLSREDRVSLTAWYRVHCDPTKGQPKAPPPPPSARRR